MNKIRKGDDVIVLAGRDKGKRGKVVLRKDETHLVVEGVNMVKKTIRPNQTNQQGGIIDMEKAVHISNVALLDPKSGKPTRIKVKQEAGKNVGRIASKSKQEIN